MFRHVLDAITIMVKVPYCYHTTGTGITATATDATPITITTYATTATAAT